MRCQMAPTGIPGSFTDRAGGSHPTAPPAGSHASRSIIPPIRWAAQGQSGKGKVGKDQGSEPKAASRRDAENAEKGRLTQRHQGTKRGKAEYSIQESEYRRRQDSHLRRLGFGGRAGRREAEYRSQNRKQDHTGERQKNSGKWAATL